MTEDEAERTAQQWRDAAPDAVLLDGFHALKHALRFGADVRLALTTDRTAAVALAAELSADVADEIKALIVETPPGLLRQLVPRIHPTGVVALDSRRSRQE